MYQQRMRKVGGAEPISRSRAAVKTPANVAPSNVQPKQRQRSSSKNKIPKTLRYDLENALVGLCDVWFADIKPHLVRNKIKLHVHAAEVEPASGDYRLPPPVEHRQPPPGAPDCSHNDPGAASDPQRHPFASSAGCCSTQPTASRARCRRPPAPSRPSPASSPVKHRTSFSQNPCDSSDAKKPRRRSRRRARLPPPEWRVPRLCRTDSFVTHTPRTQQRRRPATEHNHQHHSPVSQARRPKIMDKSTQTTSLCVTEADQTRSHSHYSTSHPQNSSTALRKRQKKRMSIAHHYYFPNNDTNLQTQVIPQQNRFPDPAVTNLRCSGTRTVITKQSGRPKSKPPPSKPTYQDAELRAIYEIDPSRVPAPCPQSLQTTRRQKKKRRAVPHHSDFAQQDLAVRRDLKQGIPSSAPCPRCPTTTNFFKPRKRQPHPPPALFKDDLIDIIAGKKDEMLKLLFESPPREEIPSIMNLVHSVQARCDPSAVKKTLPWR